MDLSDIREGVVVRPGDTLVVRVDPYVTPDDLKAFAQKLKVHATVNGFKAMVVKAAQIGVVRADEDAPGTPPASTLSASEPPAGAPGRPEGSPAVSEADPSYCRDCGGPCRDESDWADEPGGTPPLSGGPAADEPREDR